MTINGLTQSVCYCGTLRRNVAVWKRYQEKVALCGGTCPYEVDKSVWSTEVEHYPAVSQWGMGLYLVFQKSAYTNEQFAAFKSLSCSLAFHCGWVQNVRSALADSTHTLVIGDVKHSQSLGVDPVTPWVLCSTSDGSILCSHCTCTAGLGEACFHVATLLCHLEYYFGAQQKASVTEKACTWIEPRNFNKVQMDTIKNIDFETPRAKAVRFRHTTAVESSVVCSKKKKTFHVPPPTKDEKNVFLRNLYNASQSMPTPLSVLCVTDEFAPSIVRRPQYPPNLRRLFEERFLKDDVEALIEYGQQLDLDVTIQQVENLQKDTVLQSKSKLWYLMRSGRITASNFKKACRTSLENPAVSLLSLICYPEKMKFSSEATKWGCHNEAEAFGKYVQLEEKGHVNFRHSKCGLFVSTEYPHMGATPDGLVDCECCGSGCIEIKCPFCIRDCDDSDTFEEIISYLLNRDGNYALDERHDYYYQVQCHLFVARKEYCDFVVWSPSGEIFVQRIKRNVSFWEANVFRCLLYFHRIILPELLGKAWTRTKTTRQLQTARSTKQSVPARKTTNPAQREDQTDSSDVDDPQEVRETTSSVEAVGVASCQPEMSDVASGQPEVSDVAPYQPVIDSLVVHQVVSSPEIESHAVPYQPEISEVASGQPEKSDVAPCQPDIDSSVGRQAIGSLERSVLGNSLSICEKSGSILGTHTAAATSQGPVKTTFVRVPASISRTKVIGKEHSISQKSGPARKSSVLSVSPREVIKTSISQPAVTSNCGLSGKQQPLQRKSGTLEIPTFLRVSPRVVNKSSSPQPTAIDSDSDSDCIIVLHAGPNPLMRRRENKESQTPLTEEPYTCNPEPDIVQCPCNRCAFRPCAKGRAAELLRTEDMATITRNNGLEIIGIDIHCLLPCEWLSDQIINCYFRMLVARVKTSSSFPTVHAYSSFFFPDLKTFIYECIREKWHVVDIFQYDILLFPIFESHHWSLAVVDMGSSVIVYYDSMRSQNNRCLDLIESYLHEETTNSGVPQRKWSKHTATVPKQHNGYDCGVFLCLFAEHASRRAAPTFSQVDVNHLRGNLVLDIAESRLFHSACLGRNTSNKENQVTPIRRRKEPLRPRRPLAAIQVRQ